MEIPMTTESRHGLKAVNASIHAGGSHGVKKVYPVNA